MNVIWRTYLRFLKPLGQRRTNPCGVPRERVTARYRILTLILAALVPACAMAQTPPAGPIELRKQTFSEELYWAKAYDSGQRLCNRQLANRLERKFNRRFSARIARLAAYYERIYGPDPDVIATTECIRPQGGMFDIRTHFDSFEQKLSSLERRFYPPVKRNR